MKKVITLSALFAAAITIGACSDDDSNPTQYCNCNKVIEEYNEITNTWEGVDMVPYGTDCSEDTGGYRKTVDGVTFSVKCTPQ